MFRFHVWAATAFAALAGVLAARAEAASAEPAAKSQAALTAASQANKFCFLLFYKTNDPATQAAAKLVSQGVGKRTEKAAYAFVQVGDPAEQAVVQRFDVARAPMPFLLAIAPNGAISCIFPKDFQEGDLDKAFVTPTMARCMKSIQAGKLVLLCVHPAGKSGTPLSVTSFAADSHYAGRTEILAMRLDDPNEARFLGDMKIDPAKTTDTQVIFMAPPGVMIGKYAATTTTSAKLASDLHAAGKCCDDPNCKHNHK